MTDLINNARQLAKAQFEKNYAPAWGLTELAVHQGRVLAKKYGADETMVVMALYLAHTVFDKERNSHAQKNHTLLSSEFAKPYLMDWKIKSSDQKIIINSISAHHGKMPTESKEAEVVKNAECFKFLTLEGISLFLVDLRRRGMTHDQASDYALDKMNQKMQLLTLDECRQAAERNKELILNVLSKY